MDLVSFLPPFIPSRIECILDPHRTSPPTLSSFPSATRLLELADAGRGEGGSMANVGLPLVIPKDVPNDHYRLSGV